MQLVDEVNSIHDTVVDNIFDKGVHTPGEHILPQVPALHTQALGRRPVLDSSHRLYNRLDKHIDVLQLAHTVQGSLQAVNMRGL